MTKAVQTKSRKATAPKKQVTKPGKLAVAKKSAPVKKPKLVKPAVAREMMDLLMTRYPDAHCELNYKNEYELLISVILSAQTTDVTVNKVTPALFKRFPTPAALASAPVEAIAEVIRPTGYFNAKAQNIQACAQGLVERFDGKVPNTLDELTTLPGVGRKTANVVLGVVFDVPGWTVDTHVQRLGQRLGLTTNTDPTKIEKDLQKLFPGDQWSQMSITLIWHGRRTCFARKPDCPNCPINHLCPSSSV